MPENQAWIAVFIIAGVTALIRFLPFLIFSGGGKTPKPVEKLGRALPYAVMGMLVVYCLKGVSFRSLSGFAPEAIACAAVVLLHIWKRSTLISIVSGTILYMLLVQLVF